MIESNYIAMINKLTDITWYNNRLNYNYLDYKLLFFDFVVHIIVPGKY